MRRLFSSWFVIVLACWCIVAGCGGTPSMHAGTTGTTADGGATSTSSAGSGGSGGSADSSHITVSTTDQHQAPVPNIPVVVNDAAGAVVLVTQSGADGTVPVKVPLGGSVATFASYGLSFDVQAVVEPPDAATVLFTIWTADPMPPEKTTFNLTPTQIPQGTQEVDIDSCGNHGPSYPPSFVLTMFDAGCAQYPTSSFLAVAYGPQQKLLAWGTALDQPNNPGGTANVQIALTHVESDQISGTITDIPPGATDAALDIYTYWSAMASIEYRAYGDQQMPGSTYSTQLLFPKGIFNSYDVREDVTVADDGTASTDVTRERVYAALPSVTSFSATSIAVISANPLDVNDSVHPRATWSLSAGARGDYGRVYLRWGGGTAFNSYSVTFPPDHPMSFQMPDIPPELGSFAPTKTSTFGETSVEYIDDERVNGYDESALFHNVSQVDGLGTVRSSGWNKKSSP